MKTYAVQLTKIIVTHVEAESEEAAIERCQTKDGFDDSWYYAEPEVKVLGETDD
jgi:hypothetical protein